MLHTWFTRYDQAEQHQNTWKCFSPYLQITKKRNIPLTPITMFVYRQILLKTRKKYVSVEGKIAV